jgi:PhzF family phenazine biosynthesis protein
MTPLTPTGCAVHQVDAFADAPFRGNPAAVCLLKGPADESWMQNVAMEMNLSETAFVTPTPEPDAFDLRWFTPAVEVDLCGHATLAAAHVLWETRRLEPRSAARFHTRSGLLTCTLADDGAVRMDFPADEPRPVDAPPGLLDALGLAGADVTFVGRGRDDYLLALPAEGDVRSLRPDVRALSLIDARGVIATAPSDQPVYDFVSRFFAPAAGVDEDPVTGSAHCTLGPYWRGRLKKIHFTAYQASPRGGVVGIVVRGDRIALTGQAVTVLRGELV